MKLSQVRKEQQPEGNAIINPAIILAKGESLKIVLDARYLNSLIIETRCNWSIEPIQVILTKINGQSYTTADLNSVSNQMPLDEQSRHYWKSAVLFYGTFIVSAAFLAFMTTIFLSTSKPKHP